MAAKPLGFVTQPCYRPAPTQNGPSSRARDRCFAAARVFTLPRQAFDQARVGRLGLAMESNGKLREALTVDDALLRPGLSEVMPAEADIRTRITREIPINIPIIASAIDTATEAKLAIAMAQAGGIGAIYR